MKSVVSKLFQNHRYSLLVILFLSFNLSNFYFQYSEYVLTFYNTLLCPLALIWSSSSISMSFSRDRIIFCFKWRFCPVDQFFWLNHDFPDDVFSIYRNSLKSILVVYICLTSFSCFLWHILLIDTYWLQCITPFDVSSLLFSRSKVNFSFVSAGDPSILPLCFLYCRVAVLDSDFNIFHLTCLLRTKSDHDAHHDNRLPRFWRSTKDFKNNIVISGYCVPSSVSLSYVMCRTCEAGRVKVVFSDWMSLDYVSYSRFCCFSCISFTWLKKIVEVRFIPETCSFVCPYFQL